MKKLIFIIIVITTFAFNANAQTDSIKIMQIISPADSMQIGSLVTPSIIIKNCGTDTLFSINIEFFIIPGVVITESIQYIPVNDSVRYDFTQTYTSPNSNYNICFKAYNQYASDSVCKIVTATTPSNDVGVWQLIDPLIGNNVLFGDSVYFKVKIMNYGLDSQSNFPVEYQILSLAPVQEICYDTINYGDSLVFTFATPLEVVSYGSFMVSLRTALSTDQQNMNDGISAWIGVNSLSETQSNSFTLTQNYPNPASNSTTITYLSQTSGEAIFTVRDIQGKLIYQSEDKAQIGENIIELNTENFSSGVYYYSLQLGDEVQTKAFMIND